MVAFMDAKPTSIAARCWIEAGRVWIELTDQRVFSFPTHKYPRLAKAPPASLAEVQLRVGGRALRWEGLDEDIWVDDAICGRFPNVTVAA
jgi:hypothetical protein